MKKSADEHLNYFYNYIMCDIYECEFKLVGRKMANLKLGNILLGGCSVTCLQQKFEDSFDHFSSEMRLGKINAKC